jgi:hypothetical protein
MRDKFKYINSLLIVELIPFLTGGIGFYIYELVFKDSRLWYMFIPCIMFIFLSSLIMSIVAIGLLNKSIHKK